MLDRRAVVIASALWAGCTAAPGVPGRQPAEAPLIPVTTFFASRDATGDYQVSPDGRTLGWIAAVDGRFTVRFRALDGGEARVIDTHSPRSLSTFRWAADSRHVLFEQDRDGGQDQHVYAADIERPAERPLDLTPIGAARAMIHRIVQADPDRILVVHNARTRAGFDLVRIGVRSGETVVVAENPGDVIQWITDHRGALRARIRSVGERERLVEWWDGGGWRWPLRLDLEETFEVVGFAGEEVWVRTDRGRDRIALVRLHPSMDRQSVVHEHPTVDVEVTVANRATGEPLYAATYLDTQEVHFFDAGLRDAFVAVRGEGQAGFRLLSRDASGRFSTVEAYTDRGSTFWLVDGASSRRTVLGRSAITQYAEALAAVEPVSFRSRDGLTLHGYLARPRGSRGPAPMVLLVHGGPWIRDYWSYSPAVQLLANRGYAVLQVNYRGSTGYGRPFREAAVGEFAGKMHDDQLDAVDWAVGRDVADRRRVAIMGWSFGGYATLVGMTFTPEVFACGIDIVGVSDFIEQLETRHTYWTWHALRPYWHKYAGDPARPDERRRLEAASPLFRANRAQRPILIVHGANDPNVKLPQSERMVEALRRAGKDVEYVVFEGEGHGGFDVRNNVKLFETVERFLAHHLGGRQGRPGGGGA